MHFRARGSRRVRLCGRLKPGEEVTRPSGCEFNSLERRPAAGSRLVRSSLGRAGRGRLVGSTGLELRSARLLSTAGGCLFVSAPNDWDACAQVGTSPDPS